MMYQRVFRRDPSLTGSLNGVLTNTPCQFDCNKRQKGYKGDVKCAVALKYDSTTTPCCTLLDIVHCVGVLTPTKTMSSSRNRSGSKRKKSIRKRVTLFRIHYMLFVAKDKMWIRSQDSYWENVKHIMYYLPQNVNIL